MASQYGRMKWPASHGANLGWCRLVASAPGFAGEPLRGKANAVRFAYGIESMSGMCNCVSSWSGRPTVWFKTNPLNNASAIPKAIPPPASPRAILSRFLVSKHGRGGPLDRANVGHFGGVQSLVDPRLFERCCEVLVIRFVHLPLPLQVFNLRSQLRKLLRPLLNIAKPGLKRLDLCLVPATRAFADSGLFSDGWPFVPHFFALLSPI